MLVSIQQLEPFLINAPESLVTTDQMTKLLLEIRGRKDLDREDSAFVTIDVLVGWLLLAFDRFRMGSVPIQWMKIGLSSLSVAWMEVHMLTHTASRWHHALCACVPVPACLRARTACLLRTARCSRRATVGSALWLSPPGHQTLTRRPCRASRYTCTNN